jgi:hypothetical protein
MKMKINNIKKKEGAPLSGKLPNFISTYFKYHGT